MHARGYSGLKAEDESSGRRPPQTLKHGLIVNRQCRLAPKSLALGSDFRTLPCKRRRTAGFAFPGRMRPVALQLCSIFNIRNEAMQQTLLQEKYPVYSLEILKSETAFKDSDSIIEYLRSRIADHKTAKLIATFDHLAHTSALEEGEIAADILNAKVISGMKHPDCAFPEGLLGRYGRIHSPLHAGRTFPGNYLKQTRPHRGRHHP
jgi:hypothetical protein